jgi:hypothetical protein
VRLVAALSAQPRPSDPPETRAARRPGAAVARPPARPRLTAAGCAGAAGVGAAGPASGQSAPSPHVHYQETLDAPAPGSRSPPASSAPLASRQYWQPPGGHPTAGLAGAGAAPPGSGSGLRHSLGPTDQGHA